MTKEEIFEAEISPLMKQVSELCFHHGIAFLAHFAVPGERHERTQVLMACADDDNSHPANQAFALRILSPMDSTNVLEESFSQPQRH